MNELIARCAGKFIPKCADDFIGDNVIDLRGGNLIGARAIALHTEKMVRLSKRNGKSPLKIIFNGKPGLGKTFNVHYLQHLLECHPLMDVIKLNGTQLKMEAIEGIAHTLQHTSHGEYRMLWVEEADEIPRVAQVRFLTLLDELREGVAVVCTSNCALKDFENRFQTRFQVFEFAPPPFEEIVKLILRLAPQIGQKDAADIATQAAGNVRQALLDAKGVLEAMELAA